VSAPPGLSAMMSFTDVLPTAYGLHGGARYRAFGVSAEAAAARVSSVNSGASDDGWYSAGSLALTITPIQEIVFFIGVQADHDGWSGGTRKGVPAGMQLAVPFQVLGLTLTPIALVGAAARFDNRESISTVQNSAAEGTWRDGFFAGAAGRVAWRSLWVQVGWQWSKQVDGGLAAATPVVPAAGGGGFVPAPLQMSTAAAMRIGYSLRR
jgi:hypothetical protein